MIMRFRTSLFLSLSLFIFFLLLIVEGCKKSDDPTPTPAPAAAPSISSFSPLSDTTGGTITITGANFSPDAASDIVKINGVAVTVISATNTQITIKIPTGVSTGNITVTVNGQTATSSGSFTLTSVPANPTITKFLPVISGVGYPLVIKGNNFSTDILSNVVTINGVSAIVTSALDTQLIVTIPATASSGKISVTSKGQAAVSSSDIRIIRMTVFTVAGSGDDSYRDGPGYGASFYAPWGIVGDQSGNYYIADSYNNAIRKSTSSGIVSTFILLTGFIGQPYGIARDSYGNLFVSEPDANVILKITPTAVATVFAGDPNASSGKTDGTGTAARFKAPLGLSIDANNNIYVADGNNRLIRKITSAGVVSTVAGSGATGSANGSGSAASFNQPYGICLGPDGNLYVLDPGNYNIRKVTPAGLVTTFAGNGTPGTDDGSALSASFAGPIGMVFDKAGNAFVTDESGNKIRMILPDGTVVTVAGTGNHWGFDGDGGFASFLSPLGITIDPDGTMYEMDNAGMIRRLVVH
jgi:IPT/TIG domain